MKTAKEGLGVSGVCCVCFSSCPRERPCAGFQLPADGSSGSAQRQLCLLTCLCPPLLWPHYPKHCNFALFPLPCCKPAIASDQASHTQENGVEIILLLWRGKTARNFHCLHTYLLMCPFMHRTGESSLKMYVRCWVVPFLKTELIFPWELGDDGTIPGPLEGLWGLPHCYPAFPWDVSVHGIDWKGKIPCLPS